jgi:hypothetical protein
MSDRLPYGRGSEELFKPSNTLLSHDHKGVVLRSRFGGFSTLPDSQFIHSLEWCAAAPADNRRTIATAQRVGRGRIAARAIKFDLRFRLFFGHYCYTSNRRSRS